MRHLCSLLLVAISATACAPQGSNLEDLEEAERTEHGLAEGSLEAWGVMNFLNDPPEDGVAWPGNAAFDTLRGTVGLSNKAATNIAKHVRGAEWKGGKNPTEDDDPIDSIAELDAIPGVGPATMKKLLAYVKSIGGVPDHLVEGVPLTSWQAEQILDEVNSGALDELRYDVGLGPHASNAIIASRPIESVAALGEVSYVNKKSLEKLRAFAIENAVPAFDGEGPATAADFWQLEAERLPVSDDLKNAASKVSAGDYGLGPALFYVEPTELAAVMADPERQSHLAFDLLFDTLFPPGPGNTWQNPHWSGGMTATTPGQAIEALAFEIGISDLPAEEQAEAMKTLGVPVDSLIAGAGAPGLGVYVLTYDEDSDVWFDGICLIDFESGEIRVLSTYEST